jgi:hypothetical protein
LPKAQNAKDIQVIWDEFVHIINDLKCDYTSQDSVLHIKDKIKTWLQKFLKVYQGKDVTPYMHAFCYHVPEFLELYSNIEYFTQQGMEKYNDRCSKDYFRSTNHHGTDALEQLFLKRSRIQFLEGVGCERIKKSYKCRNCLLHGHTIKTCTAKCKFCLVPMCCTHLVKEKGRWQAECTLNL